MEIIKTEELSDGTFIVYFPDGSALKQYQQATTRDWFFYPSKAKDCIEQYGDRGGSGICAFAFNFYPNMIIYIGVIIIIRDLSHGCITGMVHVKVY